MFFIESADLVRIKDLEVFFRDLQDVVPVSFDGLPTDSVELLAEIQKRTEEIIRELIKGFLLKQTITLEEMQRLVNIWINLTPNPEHHIGLDMFFLVATRQSVIPAEVNGRILEGLLMRARNKKE